MPDEDVWTRAAGRQAECQPRCPRVAGGKGGRDHTGRPWSDESRDGCEPFEKSDANSIRLFSQHADPPVPPTGRDSPICRYGARQAN